MFLSALFTIKVPLLLPNITLTHLVSHLFGEGILQFCDFSGKLPWGVDGISVNTAAGAHILKTSLPLPTTCSYPFVQWHRFALEIWDVVGLVILLKGVLHAHVGKDDPTRHAALRSRATKAFKVLIHAILSERSLDGASRSPTEEIAPILPLQHLHLHQETGRVCV